MPACVSMERRAVLSAFGAELVLSPFNEGTDGAIRLAHRIFEDSPDEYYMPNQYANPDNVRAHYETTGPEIYKQTDGEIDYFVAGMGTGERSWVRVRTCAAKRKISGSSESNQNRATRSRDSKA